MDTVPWADCNGFGGPNQDMILKVKLLEKTHGCRERLLSLLNTLSVDWLSLIAIATFGVILMISQIARIDPDASYYLAQGESLYRTGRLFVFSSDELNTGRIAFAVLFAIVRLFSGRGESYIQAGILVSKLIIIINVVLVFQIARLFWGKRAALFAITAAAASTYFYQLSEEILLDPVATLFVLFSILFLILSLEQQNKVLALAAGISLGLGFYAKNSHVITFVVLPVALLILVPDWRVRSNVVNAVLYVGVFAIMVTLLYAVIYAQSGKVPLFEEGQIPDLPGYMAGQVSRSSQHSFVLHYLDRSIRYFNQKIVLHVKLAYLMIVSWVCVVFRVTVKRGKYDVVLLIALALLFPISLVTIHYNYPIRNLALVFCFSYIAIGQASVDLISLLKTVGHKAVSMVIPGASGQRTQWMVGLAAVSLVLFPFLCTASKMTLGFLEQNRQRRYFADDVSANNWYNPLVQDAVGGIEQNIPPGSKIMTTWLYSYMSFILTDAQYPMTLFHINRAYLDLTHQNIFTTVSYPKGTPNIVRLAYQGYLPYYTVLSQEELLSAIQRSCPDYLIVSYGHLGEYYSPPEYFLNNPDIFVRVYSNSYSSRPGIDIFAVNCRNAVLRDSPVFIENLTISRLLEDARKRPGYQSDAQVLLGIGQKNGDIRLVNPRADEYVQIGQAFAKEGYVEAASLAFMRAAQLDVAQRRLLIELANSNPDDPAPLLRLGVIWDSSGSTSEAYGQALAEYEKVVAANRGEVWLHFYLAEAYVTMGKMVDESEAYRAYKKAIEAYRETFALVPDNPEVRDALIKAYLALGDQYFDQDLSSEVIAAYEKDIELEPYNVQAYWKLAEVYKALGRMDEAIAVYTRAVDRWPEKADARFYLGQAYEAQGEIEAAMTEYERAIELKPTLAGAYTRLGNIYKAQERAKEAIALYRAAARKNPAAAWPHLELGKIYLEQATLD
jgi:tetratricopeptide (TPR) repeat protein/4-amino-4-deoxy-L-arabinose transferase-like glycosyltransferase